MMTHDIVLWSELIVIFLAVITSMGIYLYGKKLQNKMRSMGVDDKKWLDKQITNIIIPIYIIAMIIFLLLNFGYYYSTLCTLLYVIIIPVTFFSFVYSSNKKLETLKKIKVREGAGDLDYAIKEYENIGMKGEAERVKKLKEARGYEKALNYDKAIELYEELGMYEDARRCRELAMKQSSLVQRAEAGKVSYREIERRDSERIESVMGVANVRRMYGMNEKKDTLQAYSWGEFGVYEIVRKIGSGGFSDVYLVERSGKRYAMKIPKGVDLRGDDTIVLSEKDLEQYGKEAEIWAMLTERVPHAVINLIDAGVHPFPWFVMELGDKSLKDAVSGMRYEEKLKVAMDLLGKLDQIHHFGVVHKDIKPENVLYAGGEWKFTDFGLSKIVNKSSKSSQMLSGTLLYMAPEQISKKKFGHTDWRTDIWQMGVMIYELLTGHLPFEAEDAWEITGMILRDEPVPATEYGVSEEVWRVIEKALKKDKEERWQSAAEMKKELENIAEQTQ